MENLFHKMFESIELFVYYLHFYFFSSKTKKRLGCMLDNMYWNVANNQNLSFKQYEPSLQYYNSI